MDGTARTPPTPAAHRISINTPHPRTAVPPPPRADKHTNPTPEPAAGTSPPSPNGSAEFRVGGRLGTPGPSPPPRLREVAPRRRRLLLPAAPELRRSRDRRAPPRPGPQPPRRPARPRPAARAPGSPACPRASADRNLPQRRSRGQRVRPGARVRPSAPAHPRRRRPQEMNEAGERKARA